MTKEHCRRIFGRHGGAGFTLVELLTVITIIGILVGLLIPVVLGARKRAQINEAKITLNQLALALRNMKDYYHYDDLLGKDEEGNLVPETIMVGRELDPFNKGLGWNGTNEDPKWSGGAGDWEPHLNMKYDPYNPSRRICKRFYKAKRSRMAKNRLVDPWGEPYIYDITTRSQDIDGDGKDDDIDTAVLICIGPDGVLGTDDDVVVEADRRKRPPPPEMEP